MQMTLFAIDLKEESNVNFYMIIIKTTIATVLFVANFDNILISLNCCLIISLKLKHVKYLCQAF